MQLRKSSSAIIHLSLIVIAFFASTSQAIGAVQKLDDAESTTDHSTAKLGDPSRFVTGSFTVVVLGDTQSYVKKSEHAGILCQMTQWLVDNKKKRNIQFVTHVGDIVNKDVTVQWDRAMTALNLLNEKIPHVVVTGNHDYSHDRNISEFNKADRYGPDSFYASQPTLEGYYPDEPDSRMNTYHVFAIGDQKFLVLALEFGPRDKVIQWAKTIVDTHPNHRTILLTHGYMFDGGMWFDHSIDSDDPHKRTHDQIRDEQVRHKESRYNPHSYKWTRSDCNDGRELWNKLVKKNQNFSLVLTGHQFDELDDFPYLHTKGEHGNDVYQILFNTQKRANGGGGWIRLLEFSPDGKTVTIKTYSPFFDKWSHAPDEYYTIKLSPIQNAQKTTNYSRDGASSDIARRSKEPLEPAQYSHGNIN